MGLRIERVVTSGIFSLDGEDFDVDNNIWLIGDDHEVVVVDAAHDHRPISEAVRGRRTLGVLCTCLLYTSPSPRDKRQSRMPSSA